MNQGDYVLAQALLMLIRIGITVYCINKAGDLNRSKGGWGIFGFFLPIIAFIWIQFMKPVIKLEEYRGFDDSEQSGDVLINTVLSQAKRGEKTSPVKKTHPRNASDVEATKSLPNRRRGRSSGNGEYPDGGLYDKG